MRIAMVGACPYPVPQGSQVYLRESALALQKAGHEVRLVVYGYWMGEDSSGLPIVRSRNVWPGRKMAAGPSLGKPLLDVALIAALRRTASEQPIDAVGAHNYEALIAALAAKAAPVVYHAHNAMADELPYYLGPMARPLGAWLDRTFPKRADSVIVPHQRLAEYLIDCGCVQDRVTVVPPPLDASAFAPVRERVEDPPVLYAGNLDRYQNLGLLQKAMQEVRRQRQGTRLIVATAARGKFTGAEIRPTHDFEGLRDTLRADAVFVCPRVSWSGYPIKLLNAMAACQAIVCCKSSAHPVVHRLNGLIVPDNDAAALAASILELLRDPAMRDRLGGEGRVTVETEHDPNTIGQMLSAVYSGLMRR